MAGDVNASFALMAGAYEPPRPLLAAERPPARGTPGTRHRGRRTGTMVCRRFRMLQTAHPTNADDLLVHGTFALRGALGRVAPPIRRTASTATALLEPRRARYQQQ